MGTAANGCEGVNYRYHDSSLESHRVGPQRELILEIRLDHIWNPDGPETVRPRFGGIDNIDEKDEEILAKFPVGGPITPPGTGGGINQRGAGSVPARDLGQQFPLVLDVVPQAFAEDLEPLRLVRERASLQCALVDPELNQAGQSPPA